MSRCWIFPGSLANGYGRAWWDGRVVNVHRAAYEVLVGPIPEGHDLDHLCRNRACYNPAHLEPVTRPENVRRGFVSRNAEARHGTIGMYGNNKCRCDECRAANTAYKRHYALRRKGIA